jgi:hypothetical protein
VGLELGPLSLVSTIEELLGRNNSDCGLESHGDLLHCCIDHATPSVLKKLALISPTSGGHSVGIVRLWTKAMEIVFVLFVVLQQKFTN